MDIALIAAVDENLGLGKDGVIPWNLTTTEQQLFKSKTMDHTVIVGRTTWEGFKSSLKGRNVIVLTHNHGYVSTKPVYAVAHSLQEALKCVDPMETEVFIIGGSTVYNQAAELANKLYITRVHRHYDCDTFFPELELWKWKLKEAQLYSETDPHFTVEEYVRL